MGKTNLLNCKGRNCIVLLDQENDALAHFFCRNCRCENEFCVHMHVFAGTQCRGCSEIEQMLMELQAFLDPKMQLERALNEAAKETHHHEEIAARMHCGVIGESARKKRVWQVRADEAKAACSELVSTRDEDLQLVKNSNGRKAQRFLQMLAGPPQIGAYVPPVPSPGAASRIAAHAAAKNAARDAAAIAAIAKRVVVPVIDASAAKQVIEDIMHSAGKVLPRHRTVRIEEQPDDDEDFVWIDDADAGAVNNSLTTIIRQNGEDQTDTVMSG